MKTIFITMSRGSLIRNFFHSGVVTHILNSGARVVILTPNYEDPTLFKEYANERLILEPLHRAKGIRFHGLILEMLKGAVFNNNVNSQYLYRIVGIKKPNLFWYIPRILLFAPLRVIPGAKRFVRWIDFVINPQQEHDYLFEKYRPDLVFATTCHERADTGVLKSAQRFGVRSVQMPKSWDNPSKVLFHVKSARMLVWGDYMKDQVVKYQDYRLDEVHAVGVPQFDLYARSELLESREAFCAKLGLDPQKKIILYGSSGVSHEYEADYIRLIVEAARKGVLKDVQVFARPHLGYAIDGPQYEALAREYPEVVVDRTAKQDHRFKDHWDTSTGQIIHLYNALHHADACVTIASTLTLDATACGTPVINLRFDARTVTDFAYAIERFYLPDFVRALTKTGATWVVKSREEYLDALQRILKGERKPAAVEEYMVRQFMHALDGRSAQRIADALIGLTGKTESKIFV